MHPLHQISIEDFMYSDCGALTMFLQVSVRPKLCTAFTRQIDLGFPAQTEDPSQLTHIWISRSVSRLRMWHIPHLL